MNTRSMNVVAGAVLMLLTCACQKVPTPSGDTVHLQPTTSDSAEDTAAQSRIAGAFYAAVVPKLKTCWNRVEGKGEVEFKYTYRNEGDKWIWQKQEFTGSSLNKGQEAAAMQCMQDSARGSAFPVESKEAASAGKELVIYWGWPVPLPADTTELARMISTGGGGEGTGGRRCVDCVYDRVTHKSSCKPSRSGYTPPCVEDGTGTGCRAKLPKCQSGWSGQWGGGVVIALERGVSEEQPQTLASNNP